MACLFGVLATFALTLYAATGPLEGGSAAPVHEDFGKYLVQHQSDLQPFFSQQGASLVRQAVPAFLEWLMGIALLALLVDWVVDLLLSYGFAVLFSPASVKIKWSLIYSTGHLVLNLIALLLLGFAIIFLSPLGDLETVLILSGLTFLILGAAAQVGWIVYLYRTDLLIAFLFFLTLLVGHGFIALGIAVPMMSRPASPSSIGFVNQTLSPQIEAEASRAKQQLAAENPGWQAISSQADHLQDQLAAATDEQNELQKQIQQAKTSESYLFSQIVKIHAQGKLNAARDQLTAFLVQFPSGAMTGLAKGQLIQVENEIGAQQIKAKQEVALALQEKTESRADLLARAAQGEVTLSEMRRALIGKSRAEVSALLGPPSETASDRWGFAQQMILNPLTNEHSGLAIYFSEGLVQGLDYYYGRGAGP